MIGWCESRDSSARTVQFWLNIHFWFQSIMPTPSRTQMFQYLYGMPIQMTSYGHREGNGKFDNQSVKQKISFKYLELELNSCTNTICS
jgi:hypothetical protein